LLAGSLIGRGQIERDLKNNEAAVQHYSEAIALYRSSGHPLRLAHTVRHLADILRGMRSIESARALYEEALQVYREHVETPPLDLANAIRGFALLRGSAGERDEARILWQEARALYASLNVPAGVEESEAQLDQLMAS